MKKEIVITECDYRLCRIENKPTHVLTIQNFNKSYAEEFDLHAECRKLFMNGLVTPGRIPDKEQTRKVRTTASRIRSKAIRRWYQETQTGYLDDKGRIPGEIVKEFDALPEAIQNGWLDAVRG